MVASSLCDDTEVRTKYVTMIRNGKSASRGCVMAMIPLDALLLELLGGALGWRSQAGGTALVDSHG